MLCHMLTSVMTSYVDDSGKVNHGRLNSRASAACYSQQIFAMDMRIKSDEVLKLLFLVQLSRVNNHINETNQIQSCLHGDSLGCLML